MKSASFEQRHSMRTHYVLLLLIAAAALSSSDRFARAQTSDPRFDLELFAQQAPEPSQGRLILYTRIPHASLTFIQDAGSFTARYDVTAEVREVDERGRRGQVVMSRIFRRQVAPLPDFDMTLAVDEYEFGEFIVGDLQEGTYAIDVRIEDETTRRSHLERATVEMPSFSGAVSMSSLLLMEETGRARALRPNVANVFSTEQERVVISFSAYATRPVQTRFSYDIYRVQGRDDEPRPDDEPVFSLEAVETRTLSRGNNRVASTLATGQLRVGRYLVVARVEDSLGRTLTQASKRFELRWMGLEMQVQDIDQAIAQLGPIAKDRELEAMQRAGSASLRKQLFDTFWEKRDPTPRTERNERMEEYYYRVWYANRSYTANGERGWQSDRGRVFLRFGEPDKTESYPINASESFEIWTYEHINRRFIFVDRSGNGRFELFRPIWDERNRIR